MMSPDEMSPDEIDALFQQLVSHVREEVSVLQRISDDKKQAGIGDDGASEYADRVKELLSECLAATTGKAPAEQLQMERYWGMRFGSIYHIVECSYTESKYAEAKEAVEERIYQAAIKIGESGR